MARQTSAVNQAPGTGTNYPFVGVPAEGRYTLTDLWLSLRSGRFQQPLRVAWMYGFGDTVNSNPDPDITPANDFDIVIVDADDTVVFDSTQADTFTTRAWGSTLTTSQWIIDGVGTLRVTHQNENPEYADDNPRNLYAAPDAVLDGRTWQVMPKQVTGIRLGLDTYRGRISLQAGNNMLLGTPETAITDGGRRVSQVSLRANPGDGLGRVTGCPETVPVVKRINTVAPTTGGNFTLTTQDCYRIQRPATMTSLAPRTAIVTPATLRVSNDCTPCCECDDFVRTYRGLSRLWDRALGMGDRAEAARDQLKDNITRWENQKKCRVEHSARLVLAAEPRCRLFLGGTFCNMNSGCALDMVIRLTFVATGQDVESGCLVLPCREVFRSGTDTHDRETPYTPGGEYPIFDFTYSRADMQSVTSLRMRLDMCCDGNADRDVDVAMTVHIDRAVNIITGEEADLPTATVPSWVSDIWTAESNQPPYPARAVLVKSIKLNRKAGCEECDDANP